MADNKHLPAYPLNLQNHDHFTGMTEFDGLSKREWMAAMCLQGVLANPNSASIPLCVKYAIEAADNLLTHLQNTEK